MRNFEAPGRSLVMAKDGMAATSHPASSYAAIRILEAGGNAMDAAVAACAVQCVVEPGSTGIGGDCFALYSKRGTDDIVAFNGSGWAPRAASVEALRALGVEAIARQSPHAVTVPGAVDAWATLVADHGSMPLGRLLAAAVALARDGYAVAPRAASDWANQRDVLAADAVSRARMLTDGHAPKAGALHRQPELARALEIIGERGAMRSIAVRLRAISSNVCAVSAGCTRWTISRAIAASTCSRSRRAFAVTRSTNVRRTGRASSRF